jgi:arylsulfatase A-like enzyme
MMKKLKRFSMAFFIGMTVVFQATGMDPAEKGEPNIILILVDDLGYADLGYQGSKEILTPAIDALATSGIRYTAGYVSAPQCGPSRAGLMTGVNQIRYGYEGNNYNSGLPPVTTLPTMAEVMKKAGYVTGIVGKWHIGEEPLDPEISPWADAPWRRGFDYTFIHHGGSSFYFPFGQDRNSMAAHKFYQPIMEVKEGTQEVRFPEYPPETYLTDLFSAQSIQFIKKHRDKPFFLYLSYNAPHMPLQAKKEDMAKNEHIKDDKRRIFAGMMTALDRGIGQVLETLEILDIKENTLIVFLSDNGAPHPDFQGTNKSINGPWRGHKGDLLEGGIRIPFLISYPSQIDAGQVYDQPVSSLDLLVTLAGITGVKLDASLDYPGVSLVPTWEGKLVSRDPMIWRWWSKAAVLDGSIKLIDFWEGPWGPWQKNGHPGFYDLETNPGEVPEQALKDKELENEMRKTLSDWRERYENKLKSYSSSTTQ